MQMQCWVNSSNVFNSTAELIVDANYKASNLMPPSVSNVRPQRLWNILMSLHRRVFWAHRHQSGVNDGTLNRTPPGSCRAHGEGHPSQDLQMINHIEPNVILLNLI